MPLRPREAVKNLPPYIPAKSIDSVKKEFGFASVIKLAGNENTLGFSPLAKTALTNLTSYYPDGYATRLREKLADKLSVRPIQLVFGNGSFELLSLIGLVFLEPEDESIIAEPSFGWYKNVTLTMGAKLVSIPLEDFKVNLDAILAAVTQRTKIIWLCNPNNPTGTIFTQAELEKFLLGVREDILVVLDEAYYDFVVQDQYPQSVSLLAQYENLIILRTFSKLEGLAGLRLGYGIANEELIGYLDKVRLPLNTNAAAQLAAEAALDDQSFKEETLQNTRNGLALYYETLTRWGLHYVSSNTNFILFDIGVDSKNITHEFLKRGILIRAGTEFSYPTMLRISIGTKEENEQVLSLLGELLDKQK